MAGELRDIFSWIITTLMADTTLTSTYGLTGVWVTEAPESPAFPYIIMQKQTGGHVYMLGNQHVVFDDWILIKAVDYGLDGGDRARRISTRVAELIEGQYPTIPNGHIYVLRRQNDVDYITAELGNQQYWQVGSVYSCQYY